MGNKKNRNRKSKTKANNWRGIIKMRKSKKHQNRQVAGIDNDNGSMNRINCLSESTSFISNETPDMPEDQSGELIGRRKATDFSPDMLDDQPLSSTKREINDVNEDFDADETSSLISCILLDEVEALSSTSDTREDQPNGSIVRPTDMLDDQPLMSSIPNSDETFSDFDDTTSTISCMELDALISDTPCATDMPIEPSDMLADQPNGAAATVQPIDMLEDQPILSANSSNQDCNADDTTSLITIIELEERDIESDIESGNSDDNENNSSFGEIFENNGNDIEFDEEPQNEIDREDFKNNVGDNDVGEDIHSVEHPQVDSELSGRRIVDINFLFKQIQNMGSHSDSCQLNDMSCTEEIRNGLFSTFKFRCDSCGFRQSVLSSHKTAPIDVNNAAVLGITSVGLGCYHLNEFCTNLELPNMSEFMFTKRDKSQQNDWWELAKAEALLALKEEIRLAILNGDVDSAGNALIVIVCDGSWPKRSYNTNFTSLSGCAVIIGVRTNKVIYFDVKNKYCHICKIAQSKKEEPRQHECNTNYVGPSSSMETTIIVEGFKSCEKLGLRFKEFVADGDSSTYKAISEQQIYQNPHMDVDKDDCCNHLYRNYRTAFDKLGKATKRFDSGARKFVTKKKGNDICLGIQTAAKHWRGSSVTLLEKLVNLEQDVLNAPMHCFGIHDNCAEYFCSKETQPEDREIVAMLKSDGIFNEILNLCQTYFASSVPSLLLNYNNNAAESFNNLIAKYTGGKRINYCLAKSYQARVARSVVQYNTGGSSGSTYHKSKDSPATQLLKNFEQGRKRKVEKNAAAKAAKPKKSRYSAQVKDNGKGYGENCEANDMTPHLFEIAKSRYMEQLLDDQKNRDFVNRCTVGQHLIPKWRNLQNKLLVSRYFSRIINARGPESYVNIVEDIIYKKTAFSNTADNRHHRIYEKNALQSFTDKHGANYLSECGIFIDTEHCFLAASPFRLYGDNGLVFIRCPREAFKITIEEAIQKKLIPFWKLVNGAVTVNKSSSWYIEIQAELHIAERSFAFLVVFVESDVRIEQIYRDDDFWFDTMEKPLVFFYEQAMIKELVNPRKPRTMKLRMYNPEKKSFE